MRHFIGLCIVIVAGTLSGCMNITTSLQAEDTSVKALYTTSDCVPVVFGLANGTATVEGALARPIVDDLGYWAKEGDTAPPQRVTKVRRIQLSDSQFLFFGARCVEVVGE